MTKRRGFAMGGDPEMLLGEERDSRVGKQSHGGWHMCHYAANIQSVADQETRCLYN